MPIKLVHDERIMHPHPMMCSPRISSPIPTASIAPPPGPRDDFDEVLLVGKPTTATGPPDPTPSAPQWEPNASHDAFEDDHKWVADFPSSDGEPKINVTAFEADQGWTAFPGDS